MQTQLKPSKTILLAAGVQHLLQQKLLSIGVATALLSAILFTIPMLLTKLDESTYFTFFCLHHLLATLYLLAVLIRGISKHKWSFAKEQVQVYVPYLVMLLISAYALNRVIPVFALSTSWLSIYLVLQACTLLGYVLYDYLPKPLQYGLHFLTGSGFVLFAYLAVFVAPMYGISIIGLLLFGLSIHSFAPLLWLTGQILLVRKYYKTDKRILTYFAGGVFVSLATAAMFTLHWVHIHETINKEYNNNLLDSEDLPGWVRVSQHLPHHWITEKVLKSPLVYTVADPDGGLFRSNLPSRSFDEVSKHDPLIVFASLFTQNSLLDNREKIKILGTLYDSRHQAQERLWTGEHLQTEQVISNVRLWPEYRMAYTEKIIDVRNTNHGSGWRREEEAVYTFHLPEGSVVTSLSLWIDGMEEKGYLTTKQKADTAYRTVVGVEARDPSVIHWQEGNTVSVRVFPVVPQESRRVKVGITTPLRLEGDRLVYQNIYFDGPLHGTSDEVRRINTGNSSTQLTDAGAYTKSLDGLYEYTGTYEAAWQASVAAAPLAENTFSFNDKSYRLKEYTKNYAATHFERIYLDLNTAWTKREVETILALCKGKKVYTWNRKMVKLDAENTQQAIEEGLSRNYSLFPLHAIKDREHSLLITKGTPTSAHLADIKESKFYKDLIASQEANTPVLTYCLNSEELSPYLKSLKEFRMLHCDSGNLTYLASLLENNKFSHPAENDTELLIDTSQLVIEESTEGSTQGSAPDHLFRLYAYNQIMKKAGSQAIQKGFTDEALVHLAEQAYVVSPVSSLIVLESQKDYERFDIKKSANSLENASMKSTGAAPEPHEWALIAVVVLAIVVFMHGNQARSVWPF